MAVFKEVKNNAISTVVSGELNNTTDPVTFSVASGEGSKFPSSGSFWVTIWDKTTYADPGDDPNMEILLCTSRTGDDLTADRAEQGTSAVAHTGTPTVALLVTEQNIKDIHTAINAIEPYIAPTGSVQMWAGGSAPTGWLLCDGATISRSTYANLFAVIGTTYGAGDGSTTFLVPNLQGKFPIGYNSGDGDFDAMGETGGAKTINIAHSHTVDDHTHGASGLVARLRFNSSSVGHYQARSTATYTSTIKTTATLGRAADGANTGSEGPAVAGVTDGATPGTNSQLSSTQSIVPPYIVLQFIIKT